MLTELRSQMKLIMWILVVAFLGTIIFSWGMGGFKDKTQAGIVGEIDGQTIEYEDFQLAIQNNLQAESRKTGKELTQDEIKKVRESTWDEYVENLLKFKDAQKLGIQVTDREIAYIVENFPPAEVQQAEPFQRDGKFDPDAYKAFLRQPQAKEFLLGLENSVRNYLMEQKIFYHVIQSVDVTEEEILDTYLQGVASGKLRFIVVPFDDVEVDSSEMTEEKMMKYYRLFPDRFKQYPQRKIAYVKFDLKPSEQDTLDVKQEAVEILREIKNGADFAELAAEMSQDQTNASKGGDLGWFGPGKMVSEFEEAAFNANPGDLLGPIETKFGFHIIKVEDKRGDARVDSVKARHILLKIESSSDTRDEVYNEAFNFSQEIAERNFDTVVKEMNFVVDTTREFSQAGYIAGLGRMRMAAQFCFDNPLNAVSNVYPYPEGYIVFKIVGVVDEATKPYDDVKSSVKSRLEKIIKKNKSWDLAGDIRSKIETPDQLAAVGKEMGYKVHVTEDSLKVSGTLPDALPADSDFLKKAFRLEKGGLSDIIEGKKGYYIAYMEDKSVVNKDDFAASHEAIYMQLIRQKQDAASRNWVRELRIAADIKDYRYKYFRDF